MLQELVHGQMDLGGEFGREVGGNDHNQVVSQDLQRKREIDYFTFIQVKTLIFCVFSLCVFLSYLEVSGIHPQLGGVQFTELGQETKEIVQVANTFIDLIHDGDAVLLHWSGTGGHGSPVGEVGLSLGVDYEHPVVDIRNQVSQNES